ncbi:phosphate ABC transporter ATP-binding protein [Pantoea agglomerans]|uniref:Phosphate ABC transporter ATP-binding protein n=1 Tax=Enterobacter agglomerans TaxID=549 RepID=A0A379ADD7_ENTAG|nr:phosphate ABC transporter ATP-binding protein [Pantoea agglomerans]
MTSDTDIALTVNQLSLWYGERQALQAISLQVPKNKITALIGLRAVENRRCCVALIA